MNSKQGYLCIVLIILILLIIAASIGIKELLHQQRIEDRREEFSDARERGKQLMNRGTGVSSDRGKIRNDE